MASMRNLLLAGAALSLMTLTGASAAALPPRAVLLAQAADPAIASAEEAVEQARAELRHAMAAGSAQDVRNAKANLAAAMKLLKNVQAEASAESVPAIKAIPVADDGTPTDEEELLKKKRKKPAGAAPPPPAEVAPPAEAAPPAAAEEPPPPKKKAAPKPPPPAAEEAPPPPAAEEAPPPAPKAETPPPPPAAEEAPAPAPKKEKQPKPPAAAEEAPPAPPAPPAASGEPPPPPPAAEAPPAAPEPPAAASGEAPKVPGKGPKKQRPPANAEGGQPPAPGQQPPKAEAEAPLPPPPPPPPPPPAGKAEGPPPGAKAEGAPPPLEQVKPPPPGQDGAIAKAADGRVILRQDGQVFIRHDDKGRFQQPGAQFEQQKGPRGTTIETINRPNGVQIVTTRDPFGNIIRRERRMPNGTVVVLIDSQPQDRQQFRQRMDYLNGLPPVRPRIPMQDYIVESQQATPQQIYGALMAPPVEPVQQPYTLDEIRQSGRLRDMVPRVDVDTITFDFGQATVPQDQVGRLNVIGDTLRRIIQANPKEVYLIEGHTDAVGTDLANLALSDRRAESVAEILTYYYQIPPENLVTQGYGEQYLKVPTQAAERENRRVTLRRITPLLDQQAAQ
ncbi:MAG: OmpA family protein [Rhizobiales bacterium]|nr:OmpA family protein [Hyphomicrobiales bacterium]